MPHQGGYPTDEVLQAERNVCSKFLAFVNDWKKR